MRRMLSEFVILVALAASLSITDCAYGGLTVFFHGANNGDSPTQDMLTPIGESVVTTIPTAAALWELKQKLSRDEFSHELVLLDGDPETASEHVVLGNWQNHAWGQASGTRVAEAFAEYLLKTNPEWFSGPIDLGGHSRGGGVIYDFARTLGERNIAVEGLHFWDNHPVNGIQPQPYGSFDWGDSVPTHLDNVGFAANYIQLNDAQIPGKEVEGALNIDISASRLDHFGVVSFFHGTIDLELDRAVPSGRRVRDNWYEADLGPRDNIGFQWSHLGENPDQRPLDGVHPALGGNSEPRPVEVTGEAWPWIGLTMDSRTTLKAGNTSVEVVYSDPDSSAELSVIQSEGLDPTSGIEIFSEQLSSTATKMSLPIELDIPDSGSGYLHFILDDGDHIKYTTAEYAHEFDLLLGDFDLNTVLDANDLDLLGIEIRNSGGDVAYDVNSDSTVDELDRDFWVTELAGTRLGDANLDRQVNFSDFLTLSSGFGKIGGWANGDFDGDGKVSFPDFLAMSANFGHSSAAPVSVPEPSSICLFLLGLVAITKNRVSQSTKTRTRVRGPRS